MLYYLDLTEAELDWLRNRSFNGASTHAKDIYTKIAKVPHVHEKVKSSNYIRAKLLKLECVMQGMLTENMRCRICNEALAYVEADFTALVNDINSLSLLALEENNDV